MDKDKKKKNFDPSFGIDESDFDIFVDGPPCPYCEYWRPKKTSINGKFDKVDYGEIILCHIEEENPKKTMEPSFKCFRLKEELSNDKKKEGKESG
ncbi:MAG: hypothetical protein GF387_00085 [Candidatus Portnoybacteria bacterium]|nr:hypothetical protein [Candidatus Portnoybacteria bacterium]